MSFHTEQIKEFLALVEEEVRNTTEIITQGIVTRDFASYKEQVGRLHAYKRALELIKEAAEIVEKRE